MPRLRRRGGDILFALRLTPKGGRDAVEGWATGADGSEHLKARVASPPQDGKANAALIALLAKIFGVPKTTIVLVAGETSRMKTVRLTSPAPDAIRRLENIGAVP